MLKHSLAFSTNRLTVPTGGYIAIGLLTWTHQGRCAGTDLRASSGMQARNSQMHA